MLWGAASPTADDPLLAEAVTSLEDLSLVRFQATHDIVGTGTTTMRYSYIYRNDSAKAGRPRSYRVLPLIPTSRSIHHDMRVVDAGGRNLVYLDSTFSRRALGEYAGRLARKLVAQIESITDEDIQAAREKFARALRVIEFKEVQLPAEIRETFLFTIRQLPLNTAFESIHPDDGDYNAREKLVQEACDAAVEDIQTIFDFLAVGEYDDTALRLFQSWEKRFTPLWRKIPLTVRARFSGGEMAAKLARLITHWKQSPQVLPEPKGDVERRKRLQPAIDAAGKLLQVLQLRQNRDYQPFVLLDQAVKPHGGRSREAGGGYVMVRQYLSPGDEPRLRGQQWWNRIPAWLHDAGKWARHIVVGTRRVQVDFPIVSNLRSYHFRVLPARGVDIGGRKPFRGLVKCINLAAREFREDNAGARRYHQSSSGIHLYRRRDEIESYAAKIERTRVPWKRGRIWLSVLVKEVVAVPLLFGICIALAIIYAVDPQPSYLAATIGAGVALVAQSLDRPLSQRALPIRILLVAAIAAGPQLWSHFPALRMAVLSAAEGIRDLVVSCLGA